MSATTRSPTTGEESNNSPSDRSSGHDEITDSKEWTEGDFEVITADKVRFRVPSYRLFAARLVTCFFLILPALRC